MIPTPPENSFNLLVEDIRLWEFDMGGVLYHANYFHLYEHARESILKEIGYPYSDFVKKGQHSALIETHQNFILPIYYGQNILLKTWLTNLKKASVVFHYLLIPQNGKNAEKPVHYAWTKNVLVCKGDEGFKTTRFPDKISQGLEKFSS